MAEGKLTVGNVEIVALTDIDVDLPIPLSHLFPGVSAEAWAPFQQRYPDAFSGPDVWRAHFGGFLIRSQGRTILVDTGLGSVASNPGTVSAFAAGVDGQLMAGLRAEGVDPENVDTVFFTHLHPDHVGWNLIRRGTSTLATFSKARYVAHQADWQAFQQPEVQKAFPFSFWEETLGPLEQLGVLDLITGEPAIGSTGTVQRSLDGGATWETRPLPVEPNSGIWWFATHTSDPDLVLANSLFGELYRSHDAGDSWEKLKREFSEVRTLVWVPN